MGETETKTPRRISSFFIAIIVVTLALSIFAIYSGANAYINGETGTAYPSLLIGVSGLALSAYMLFQTRGRTLRFTLKMQPVTTTLLCQKCGFKNLREFQRGDYIFKEAEECPKCKEKMQINSIYREADEKE